MKNIKNIIYKIIFLFLVFAAIIVAVIFFNRQKDEKTDITMGEPALPTVSILCSAGEGADGAIEVNELFGYKTQMDTKYMRDTITPISSTRTITVRVRNFNNLIMGAGFELRSLDCDRLIENTDIASDSIAADGEYTNISITFDNMIEPDREYFLVVRLHTDRADNVYYYTRIIQLSENHLREETDFVRAFSDATYSKDSDKIISYIEPNASEDNTNFGHVTIHSNYKQITWGELAPEKVTMPIVSIKELLGDVGCYELTYKVRAFNDYEAYQYYMVKEFFRVKWTGQEIYLLDYDRTMNQIFDATNQNISTVRINLGISEEETCEFVASDNTSYIAFAKRNGLWLMDIRRNQVISLFAFQSPEEDDIRDANTNNDIRIISVDNEGNTKFIVCGYMNRGEHEGMVGVSLYEYSSKDNIVREKIFIPFARQYGILSEMMGRMFYVNENNVMYIMLNDSVYSVDLTGSEYVQIISELSEDSFSTNKAGNLIAWENDGKGAGSTSINILDLETGDERRIDAPEGTRLKVVGYIDNDFVFGIAGESDIVTDINGKAIVAMNKLVIMNEDNEVIKEYTKDGYYFTDTDIAGNMINVTRVTRSEDGVGFVKADDYQIFGNEEEDTNVVSVGIITTERKKKEVVIEFVKKVTSSNRFKNVYPEEIIFSDTNSLNMHELISNSERYYIYGLGEVKKITDEIGAAIQYANDVSGVVIDENGEYAWARISRPTGYEIAEVNVSMENISAQIEKNLTGTTLDEMFYYICNRRPVLGMTDNSGYVIIVGYDFYNVILLKPDTGERYKQGQEEAAAMFAAAGNRFMLLKQ